MLKNILKKIKLGLLPCKENDCRPRILTGGFIFYYLLILLILKLVVLPIILFLPETDLFADISRSVLVELTNRDRETAGLSQLKENTLLNEAAHLKAKDILALDYFNHYSPQGKSPWYWFNQSGYEYWTAGENLGIGFLDSEEIYQAWYDSSDHRYNILNPDYQEIGIAVLEGEFKGNKTKVVVQLFGSPKGEVVAADNIPESGTTPDVIDDSQLSQPTQPTQPTQPEDKGGDTLAVGSNNQSDSDILHQGIVLGETYLEKFEPDSDKEEGLYFKFLKFMVMDYDNLIQTIILYSLIIISLFTITLAAINFDFNHRDIVFNACLFTFILLVFLSLNKELLIKIIPHNLGIY